MSHSTQYDNIYALNYAQAPYYINININIIVIELDLIKKRFHNLGKRKKTPPEKYNSSYYFRETAFLDPEVCNFHSNFFVGKWGRVEVGVIIHGTVQKAIMRAITNSAFRFQLSKEHVGMFCLLRIIHFLLHVPLWPYD